MGDARRRFTIAPESLSRPCRSTMPFTVVVPRMVIVVAGGRVEEDVHAALRRVRRGSFL